MPQRCTILRGLICGLAAAATMSLGVTTIAAPTSDASAVNKTVVTWAEAADAEPNYIFPYLTSGRFTIANINELDYYMYRPLYYFGGPASVTLNTRLSLAKSPVFSNGDKTVKISLKAYKWSDGTRVTVTNIMFWMNIWKMDPAGYAGWFPGGLSMPTSVKSVKITNPTTLTMTFDRSFNPHWLLYNELSQITPLPLAWTKSSTAAKAGSGGCAKAAFGTADAACKAVYDYLSEQSGYNPTKPKETINAFPTYATNPLWKVVDGPWTLVSFGLTADVVFKPNPLYSGPNKPSIKEFIEKPFTSSSAEFDALATGTVDIGYLPITEVTQPAAQSAAPGRPVKPGPNNPRLGAYKLSPFYIWGVSYFPLNMRSTGDAGEAGKIFSQLYIRQAIQRLFDQTLYVKTIFKGYGYADYGPVPSLPKNPYTSKTELKNPYPYSVSVAKSLLTSHGWKVVKGGTSVCEKPGSGSGDCGAGIRKGAKLAFTLQYASGTTTYKNMMVAAKSSWSTVGIHVTLGSATTDAVLGASIPCPKGCSWEIENWLVGWEYVPDIYPTGEEIFASGAGENDSEFTTAHNNALIRATDVSSTNLTKYENYLEKELPVVWQPEPVTLEEIHKTLAGVSPTDPLNSLTPATYHWK